MAVYFGRLEAFATAPAGTYELVDSGGTYNDTLTAGELNASGANASFTTLLQALNGWLNTYGTDAWNVTIANGEAGTGLVTIECDYQPWSLSLPSSLWAALGFTGDIVASGTAQQTGTKQATGIWLPNRPLITERGYDDDGTRITDMRQTISPRGDVYTVWGNSMTENTLTWMHLPASKVLTSQESTANTSFETFWANTHLGDAAIYTPGYKYRLFWDADNTTPYTDYKVLGLSEFRPEQVQQGWTGLWNVRIPRVLKVPS